MSLAGIGACNPETPLAVVTAPAGVPEASAVDGPVPLTPLVPLDIPTYEHSGQAVHPDVVRFGTPWHGWEYWMAMTPFPKGMEAFENPSILVSHDGLRWQVPADLKNPLAATPAKKGYNSDPDLSYDAVSDQLVMLYREVTATHNVIYAIASPDGRDWTPPRLSFIRRNHGMVSPTATFTPAGTPSVWYVDAGPKHCAERMTRVKMQQGLSADALLPATAERGWSPPKRNGLVQAGHNIWHLDVTWVPERREYWAVYVAYPGHQCWGQDLYFARSSDGQTWTTYNAPFLRHQAGSWTGSTLYRASVMYDASRDVIQFFVSGEASDHTWRLGYVDYRLAPFLAALERSAPDPVTASPADRTIAADSEIEP